MWYYNTPLINARREQPVTVGGAALRFLRFQRLFSFNAQKNALRVTN